MKNNPIRLPGHDRCTGCGACVQTCPAACITFEKDGLDAVYPAIDESACLQCGACERVCHLQRKDFYGRSDTVYAAWSNNDADRRVSASGGAAAAVYRYALDHGIKTFGVKLTQDFSARFFEIKNAEDIGKAQNSKYLFSYTDEVYPAVRQYLKDGRNVIFIGLPCQVAGLLGFLGSRDKRLLTIDIICHGTCPEDYLKQHIDAVKKRCAPDAVSFRDPAYGTNRFVFSLRRDQKKLYASKVHAADVYQLGYHQALFYRENCYHCRYACPQRVGDITISDFSGLGMTEPWEEPHDNISCVICSSDAGAALLKALTDENRITLIKRPADEAFLYEKQLRAPSVPHPSRNRFLEAYAASRRFEEVCAGIFADEIKKNRIRMMLKADALRSLPRKLVPRKLKHMLKRILNKSNG